MKKILLSGFVIVTFLLYSFNQRSGGSGGTSATASAPNPSNPDNPQTSSQSSGRSFKNGVYTGEVADAFYGNVQVQATIKGGKMTDVEFLDYPKDRQTSEEINSQAIPYLKQEAIQAQSANVDVVSGATQTSGAFQQSLQSALAQAQ